LKFFEINGFHQWSQTSTYLDSSFLIDHLKIYEFLL